MSIFYNVKFFTSENLKHIACLFVIFALTFLAIGGYILFFTHGVDLSTFWFTVKNVPIIFGTLTYVVLGISLSYLTHKSLAKIICFTAVVTDQQNSRLITHLLTNLFLLNVMASTMIGGYIVLYFAGFSVVTDHVLNLLLSSLIAPITFTMRIFEGCIDKLVHLEISVENNCFRFVK